MATTTTTTPTPTTRRLGLNTTTTSVHEKVVKIIVKIMNFVFGVVDFVELHEKPKIGPTHFSFETINITLLGLAVTLTFPRISAHILIMPKSFKNFW